MLNISDKIFQCGGSEWKQLLRRKEESMDVRCCWGAKRWKQQNHAFSFLPSFLNPWEITGCSLLLALHFKINTLPPWVSTGHNISSALIEDILSAKSLIIFFIGTIEILLKTFNFNNLLSFVPGGQLQQYWVVSCSLKTISSCH